MRAAPSPWDSAVFGVRVGSLWEWRPGWTAAAVRAENAGLFDVVFVKADGWVEPPEGSVAHDHLYDMESAAGPRRAGEVYPLWTPPTEALLGVAESSFLGSRIFRDPRLSARAAGLYRRWCSDASGRVLVLYGREDALLVEGRDPDGAGRIELLAVGEAARGRGAGASLVRGAMTRPGTPDAWRVRVSCGNWRAVRFYGKIGFVVRTAKTAFHVWVA